MRGKNRRLGLTSVRRPWCRPGGFSRAIRTSRRRSRRHPATMPASRECSPIAARNSCTCSLRHTWRVAVAPEPPEPVERKSIQFWSKVIIVIQILIIDCHAHIYSFDEKKYPPRANPFRPPKFVGSVEHLHHVSQAAGVSAVRAIQAVTFYGYDNSYLIDSTRDHRDWICGVCTLDPDDARSPGLLRQYVRRYGVKSLRSIPSAKAKSFDDPGVRAYGADRCMWTSCYPNEIWTPKITYAEHLRIFTEALPLKDSERKLILGENARKIWFKNAAHL